MFTLLLIRLLVGVSFAANNNFAVSSPQHERSGGGRRESEREVGQATMRLESGSMHLCRV